MVVPDTKGQVRPGVAAVDKQRGGSKAWGAGRRSGTAWKGSWHLDGPWGEGETSLGPACPGRLCSWGQMWAGISSTG